MTIITVAVFPGNNSVWSFLKTTESKNLLIQCASSCLLINIPLRKCPKSKYSLSSHYYNTAREVEMQVV